MLPEQYHISLPFYKTFQGIEIIHISYSLAFFRNWKVSVNFTYFNFQTVDPVDKYISSQYITHSKIHFFGSLVYDDIK